MLIGRTTLFALSIGFLFLTSALGSTGARFTADELVPIPRYGVHTLQADRRELSLAREAGFDAVVQLFTWWEIEPTKNQFLWQTADETVAGAAYYDLDLIVRLDKHPEWATTDPLEPGRPPVDLREYDQWVRRVVARYRGQVAAYIIWNEPNLSVEWSGLPPDPAAYADLLQVGYAAVKETDPDALVISAGLAPTNTQSEEAMDERLYLRAMYEAGAQDYFDVLGAHPYGFGYPPDDPHGAHDGQNLARLQDLRQIMVRYGDTKPVWITEMGWTVRGNEHSAWQAVSQTQQAEYLVDALSQIRMDWPWVELITIWNLGGESILEFSGYSLLAEDGLPRPSYLVVQEHLAIQSPPAESVQSSGEAHPDRYQVLAEDTTIHLGDKDLPYPWAPIHKDQIPSTVWRGTVYVYAPGDSSWQLTARIMQSNFWSNRIWINGTPLPEPIPLEDFTKSWVSHTFEVPPGLIEEGPNEVSISLGHAMPLIQAKGFGYDKLQVKDVVLWQEEGS